MFEDHLTTVKLVFDIKRSEVIKMWYLLSYQHYQQPAPPPQKYKDRGVHTCERVLSTGEGRLVGSNT